MNNQILSSVLKKDKGRLVLIGTLITSTIFIGVGLFSRLGKTGFALGITGFIPLAAFSLLIMAIAVHSASNKIKKDHKISKEEVKRITTVAMPLILGIVLTGIGLFGNKLDSNVKFIAGIVGFVALSFFLLFSSVNCAKEIKREYESALIHVENYENSAKELCKSR